MAANMELNWDSIGTLRSKSPSILCTDKRLNEQSHVYLIRYSVAQRTHDYIGMAGNSTVAERIAKHLQSNPKRCQAHLQNHLKSGDAEIFVLSDTSKISVGGDSIYYRKSTLPIFECAGIVNSVAIGHIVTNDAIRMLLTTAQSDVDSEVMPGTE